MYDMGRKKRERRKEVGGEKRLFLGSFYGKKNVTFFRLVLQGLIRGHMGDSLQNARYHLFPPPQRITPD